LITISQLGKFCFRWRLNFGKQHLCITINKITVQNNTYNITANNNQLSANNSKQMYPTDGQCSLNID